MSDEIFVVGYPKSGNTWLSRLLGDALDSPVKSGKPQPSLADNDDGKGKYIIRQRHHLYNSISSLPERVVFILRDPRDLIVSVTHYWGFESVDEYIRKMANLDTDKRPNVLIGYERYIKKWKNANKPVKNVVTTYEKLSLLKEKELDRILKFLKVDAVKPLDEVFERQSFASMKKRVKGSGSTLPYGESIQSKLLRKGVVGDWKNHITKEHGRIIHEHLWHCLMSLGYENDEDWWTKLKE